MRQLEHDDSWELYRRHPEIPETLCRKFAGAISRQMASRGQRASQRLGKRVAMMFDNLAEHAGSETSEGGVRIALPVTQRNIADLFFRCHTAERASRGRELKAAETG
jgi:CRP-like cAMP-binding protein